LNRVDRYRTLRASPGVMGGARRASMKIVVVGSTGTIGLAVVRALSGRHEVIGVSRHGQPAVDLGDGASIAALFRTVTGVDAVICCAGGAAFKPLAALTDQDFTASLQDKLMGQVRLVREALPQLRDGGSVTVTSGVLAQRPMAGGAAYALVNAAVEGFARVAALEAPRGVRVNVVSPPWVEETLQKLKMPPQPGSLPASAVARAYVVAVEGKHQGEVLDPARLPAG
jgi:NAD(P)-dependent dehydrogenase (short-subunit alcohol dehydrogenase family)